MVYPRAWQNGLGGDLVPFGKHKVVKEVEFVTQTSLPSWLTGFGTQTQLGPNTTYHGSTQFATAATIGATAGVTSSFQLDSSKYEAILFELEGCRFLGNSADIKARFDISGSSNAGAWAEQLNSTDHFTIHHGAAGATDIGYDATTAPEGGQRRCMGFMIAPVQKEVYFLDSGGIVGYKDASADWVDGLVNFGFKVTAATATAVSWRASVMRFSLWWN